jgi:leader peptidase (prepilin peptidase)/N-methyltransferase
VSDVLVAIVSALVVAGLSAVAPRLIATLPEPEPDPEPDPEPEPEPEPEEAVRPADAEQEAASERVGSPMSGVEKPPKVLYADLASRPQLGLKLALWGAVVGLLLGLGLGDEPILLCWLYLGVVGVILGYIDAQTRLLPTRIIGPSYAVVVVLIGLAAALDGETDDLIRAGLGWLAFGGFYFLLWVVYPRGLGYGDVRLSGLLGLALGYLGWGEVLVGMYAGFLLGGIIGGVLALLKVVDRKRYPFGPFMLVGAVIGVLAGQPFADWYLGR